jgi:hypothetical protein
MLHIVLFLKDGHSKISPMSLLENIFTMFLYITVGKNTKEIVQNISLFDFI